MIVTKTIKDIKPVLMESTKKVVKDPYELIVDKTQVIFVVSPGLNGVEFNKTAGYLNHFSGMQNYQCLNGSGILLMQRNDEMNEAKEFRMARLHPHKQVDVPAGWFVCLVNTGNKFLVVLRNSTSNEKYQTPKPILEKKGFAYYVVEKKGEITFDQNPNYQLHPQISME